MQSFISIFVKHGAVVSVTGCYGEFAVSMLCN